MRQKVLKVGNSAAVTIPKKWLDETGLKPGDEVVVKTDMVSEKLEVYSVRGKKKVDSSATPDLMEWIDRFHAKYGKALKDLANK